MARKKDVTIPLPDDVGGDFEDEHHVLNYRPRIEFVEPPAEAAEPLVSEEPEDEIGDVRNRTQNLIQTLDAVGQLIDQAQGRIDQRVKAMGGVNIKLDPNKDAAVIAAMKRRFPDKEDPTIISYDDYKQAMDCIQRSAPSPLEIAEADMNAARADPLRTDFGGLGNTQGENRAEISSPASSVEPVDLEQFQKNAVVALFSLMLPLITQQTKADITQHKLDTPHK